MSSSRAVHRPYPGITPEQARDLRAKALAYAFQCWHEKAAEHPTPDGPDDTKESKNNGAARTNPTK